MSESSFQVGLRPRLMVLTATLAIGWGCRWLALDAGLDESAAAAAATVVASLLFFVAAGVLELAYGGRELGFDAFISYSQRQDKIIATALQSTMQRLGKPWYQRRALRVFRD